MNTVSGIHQWDWSGSYCHHCGVTYSEYKAAYRNPTDGYAAQEPYPGCPLALPLADPGRYERMRALVAGTGYQTWRGSHRAANPSGLAKSFSDAQQASVTPIEPGYYVSAPNEWPQHDDGSAAHEPSCAEFTSPADARPAVLARLTAQAEQIGRLICERDRLRREIEAVRGLLSRVEDAPTDPVQSDIDRTIDHLLNGRTTKDQRKGLNTATERAERVTPSADAAVGRALR